MKWMRRDPCGLASVALTIGFLCFLRDQEGSQLRDLSLGFVVFPASRFRHILETETPGGNIFKDTVLVEVSEKARGELFAKIVRKTIQELHPTAVLKDPELGFDCNGKPRRSGTEPYDFLWDGRRVEVKSALLSFLETPQQWQYFLQQIKLANSNSDYAAFDVLLLCLVSPLHIFIVQHDLAFRVSRHGVATKPKGFCIQLRGPRQCGDWKASNEAILKQLLDLGTNCQLLANVSLRDLSSSFQKWRDEHPHQQTYAQVPLSTVSSKHLGQCIERLVRETQNLLRPELNMLDPAVTTRCDGRRRSHGQQLYDWMQDGRRFECKCATMRWNPCTKRWVFQFVAIKPSEHDELLLALRTPGGLHIYRHDGKCGMSRSGASTEVYGHEVSLYGPGRVECWKQSLADILRRLDASGCECLAYVDWHL